MQETIIDKEKILKEELVTDFFGDIIYTTMTKDQRQAIYRAMERYHAEATRVKEQLISKF